MSIYMSHLIRYDLYVFSSTKYPLLKALVDGTSTQYMSASPVAPVNFGAQRLSNVADPVSAQDAVSKNYDDGNLGGKTLDVTGVSAGVGGGRTLAWDQVANKWVTNASTGTVTNVNTGTGLLGGPISSSGTISVDVGTTALKILQLNASAQLPAVDGSLLINLNSTKLQSRSVAAITPSAGQVLAWNSSSSVWEPQTPSSAGVTGLTGDVTASGPGVVAATIASNAITSAKINSAGIAINRLLITDATTGNTVTYAACTTNQIMQYNGLGWACANMSTALGASGVASGSYGTATQVPQFTVNAQGQLTAAASLNIAFPVTSVAGRTGAVTLTAADITGLGTAATQNAGTTALNLLQLNGSGSIPAVDGGLLTNINSTRLQNRSIAATAPSAGQVLTWNNTSSFWEPQPTQVNVNTILRNGNSFAAPLAMGTTDGFGLSLMTNNLARLTIDPAGNVGIGTTTPSSILSLQLPSSTSKGIVVKSAVGQSVNLEEWQDSAASPLAFVDQSGRITSAGFKASGSGTASLPVLSYNGSSAGLFFPTALTVALSTNGAERLRVDSTGNVGIGITTPAATLDVAGNVKLGLAGTPFTASGICTAGSTVYTIGSPVPFTCTGVPASTSVAVNCSPTTALAGYVTARATGTLNQIAITTGIGGTFTMTCMWMAP